MSDIMPNPDCDKCRGDSGWHRDLGPHYRDRQREWVSCDCWIECESQPEDPKRPALRLIRGGKP